MTDANNRPAPGARAGDPSREDPAARNATSDPGAAARTDDGRNDAQTGAPSGKPAAGATAQQAGAAAYAAQAEAHAAQPGARAVQADAGEADAGAGELAAQLAEAQQRAQQNQDLYVRALAEMDNVRKRAQADVANAHKYAIEGFAESLLPVRDSLEMALKVDAPTVENVLEGVGATLRLLANAFEKHRLVEIDPVKEKFDPNRHQAISMVPSGEVPPNHVVSVLQKGYMINDRVLRPALVTVRQGA